MNKLLAIVLSVVCVAAVYAFQIEKCATVYSHTTNTFEEGTVGFVEFTANGPNLTIYSTGGAVDLLQPTITNSTLFNATNTLGATWEFYDTFVDTTAKTYEGIFKVNGGYRLRFVGDSAAETNAVTLLIY